MRDGPSACTHGMSCAHRRAGRATALAKLRWCQLYGKGLHAVPLQSMGCTPKELLVRVCTSPGDASESFQVNRHRCAGCSCGAADPVDEEVHDAEEQP